MITPKELIDKTEKSFFKVVSSQLRGETIFPWIIPSNKLLSGTNFSDWKNDLMPLYKHSKSVRGKGYTVDWKEKKINGSRQSVPERIYFESFDDFLFFIGRKKDYEKITTAKHEILDKFPVLEGWANENPNVLLNYYVLWSGLIKVCQYFSVNPPPHHDYYIRELPIEVHSKFIEQNVQVLKKLLDLILPDDWVNKEELDFSSRYMLKKVNIQTQIRILDDALKPYLGYDECALRLDDAAWLQWLPEKVFIIENKACYLSFPKSKNSVALFGEGFKSRITKHIPWLEKTQLFCWFDLDAAGFEMLDSIRQYYPKAKIFLMDEATYLEFEKFAVENSYKKKELLNLSPEEKKLYDFIVSNCKRLEQERISQQYVKLGLAKIGELYPNILNDKENFI